MAGGCVVAGFFGLYDWSRVIEAPWVGIPTAGFGGWDLRFGPAFWALLPAFVFVTVVGAIETVGDAVAIQRVSWRSERAVDYRSVQGAVNADGLGNLLSGLLGTIPNTTYSTSVAVAELTGVGARVVGVYIGALFLAFAFLPKITAVLLAIPGPVAGAYIMVLLSMLFVLGMKIVIRDGVDYKKGAIVGVSFWIGVGFQHQLIFADRLGEWWGALLGNGLTSGGICAILITVFIDLTSPRRSRLNTDLHISSLPKIDEFLVEFASRANWNETSVSRLRSVGEETLSIMLVDDVDGGGEDERRLIVSARLVENTAELEFLAVSDEENLEDRLSYLSDQPETVDEREISFRLLRHYSQSVQHRKYHNVDIVAVEVEGSH